MRMLATVVLPFVVLAHSGFAAAGDPLVSSRRLLAAVAAHLRCPSKAHDYLATQLLDLRSEACTHCVSISAQLSTTVPMLRSGADRPGDRPTANGSATIGCREICSYQ